MSSYSWLIIFLGIFLIVSIWFFIRDQINADYDRTNKEAAQETMNLAIAFEEHVRGVVADVDKDLLNIKNAYERDGVSSPVFVSYAMTAAKNPSRVLVAVYDEQGYVIKSLIKNALGKNRADREYFKFHRSDTTGTLHIGRPILSRLGHREVIPMSRRINKPDGSFGGIVYIGLKVDYFLSFYQKIDLGQDQLISLMDKEGFVFARQTGKRLDSGQDVKGSTLWQRFQAGLNYGTHTTSSLVDGINRVVSFRVMTDYPIVILVGKSTQAALTAFERHKQGYIIGAFLVSVFILAVCGLLVNRHEKMLAKEGDLQMLVTERTQDLESTVGELQRASAQVAEQAQLLELAHDYIMVRKLDGEIVYWNRGAESGYGWLAGEAIGQVIDSLLKTRFSVAAESVMDSLLTEGHWEGEVTYTRKDGRQIVVQSNHTLVRDAAGNPLSIMEINHDITEQKKYEAEIARLDRLNIIGEMAAGIGHEVRNPMTTVRGYLQRFARKPDLAEHRESFALMIEELDRANAIISEFLGLAKNKAVTLASTNLNMIIRSLFPLLLADALRRGNDIEMELEDIPDVLADEKELRQCILNLVNNGLDAMPEGGKVTIGTAEAGGRVVMTVRDRGPGIPPEIQDKLGTPFMTTKENGTGLGLPVCYRIAQRHQATIEVETSPQGTAFRFIFNKKIVTG